MLIFDRAKNGLLRMPNLYEAIDQNMISIHPLGAEKLLPNLDRWIDRMTDREGDSNIQLIRCTIDQNRIVQ